MNKLDETLSREVWKSYGAVTTPVEVIDFILRVLGKKAWQGLKILEPGCGFCDFLKRIYDAYPNNEFVGVELNPQIYNIAKSSFPQFKLVLSDFLLWDTHTKYDVVIGNPPYGIIGNRSHYPIHIMNNKKESYKKHIGTWYGKFNIYGAFIEKGIKLLKNRGKLVFIVPATFMILDDFRYLRKFLSQSGRVKVFYLGPRVFKGKSVSTAVLMVHKGLAGIELYGVTRLKKTIKYYSKDSYDGGIIRFDSAESHHFEESAIPLGSLFSMHFAARSPEVKKHPLVSSEPRDGLVPILTGRNLHPGFIDYERCYSGLWMPKEAAASLRNFYAFAHIVVGHTKGGKLVAAVDELCYPWREEIHLVPKVDGLNLDAVTEYLNSARVQHYMRILYKDITPHTTITQLKQLPMKGVLDGKRNKRLALI